MKLRDLILTANRNLARSKLRTTLTILAIFVGGFTLTLTTALNTGARDYLDRQLGNVTAPGVYQVMPQTDTNPFSSEVREYDVEDRRASFDQSFNPSMTQADVDKIASTEGIDTAVPFYMIAGEYIKYDNGTPYEIGDISQDIGLNLDLVSGRLQQPEDRNTIIIGEDYIEPLGLTAESAIGQQVTIAYRDTAGVLLERQFEVIGVTQKTVVTSGMLIIDTHSAKEIAEVQGQGHRFVAIMATFNDNAIATATEQELKQRLQDSGNYSALSLEERIGTVISVVSAITMGLNVVGIIALIAASFGIINTLLMSVYERTQEIGLMKSLGMSRAKVFNLFAVEAVLVGFWGSVVAVTVATLASLAVNSWASQSFLKDFEGFTLLAVTPMGVAFVIGLIMAIAFVAGTLPALKASRLNPIEALRSE